MARSRLNPDKAPDKAPDRAPDKAHDNQRLGECGLRAVRCPHGIDHAVHIGCKCVKDGVR